MEPCGEIKYMLFLNQNNDIADELRRSCSWNYDS